MRYNKSIFGCPSAKKSGKARKQAGKKEGGLSVIPTRNFCPLALPREAGLGVGINPQNPLDFAQNGFGFRPANTARYFLKYFGI
ncbi:MAG: hypothetical protein AB1465_05170 [Patescibacteria group bacterium]